MSDHIKAHERGGQLEFPYLVVRWMATVYQRIPIRMRVGGLSFEVNRHTCELQCTQPILADGKLNPSARVQLIEQVRLAVQRLRLRMCIIWAPAACTYVEFDKCMESTTPPSGGVNPSLKIEYQTTAKPPPFAALELSAAKAPPREHLKEWFGFTLTSGRTVRMTDLHISSTHGEMNVAKFSYADHDIKRALTAMEKYWGPRATWLVPPAGGTYVEHNGDQRLLALLPGLRYHAWLISEPLDTHFCGSELVVIWFGFAPIKPLEEFVANAVKDVPWEEHARDFNW